MVTILTGENYESHKADILRRLADGEKIFVISTYKTIGEGQNMQYQIPEILKDKLIHSNSFASRGEKDFDAVYLEKPTNLIVNITDDLTEKNLIKYIFQMEFLQENYEISTDTTWNKIKNAFISYFTNKKYYNDKVTLSVLESIKLYATTVIIQAIGCICRTNMKNENIYIFADSSLTDITKYRIFNFEFVSLCDRIRELKKNYSVPDRLTIKADTVSIMASRHIDTMLDNAWTDKTMYFWKTLRDFVMKYPTISGQEKDTLMIRDNYFIQLPAPNAKYYYSQSDDFRKISVSFTPEQDYSIADEAKTRLNIFMKWEALRKYFTRNGYATEFKPAEYIMSPAVWNNIYKGALGEAVGKFWFSEILDINLEELDNPEIFETFDFRIPEKQIFIDFKNWSENYDTDLQETLDKIYLKSEKCDLKVAIIANVIAGKKYATKKYEKNGRKIIVIPSLLRYVDNEITVNEEAIYEIRRCSDEYTD
ncbi:MAG: hypothetical protein HDT23_03505 [Ruminococcus sp.]|nr:hypothetical protein [Ruminococcus sp.]